MKTDYSQEIENLLLKNFAPASADNKEAVAKNLSEINEMVTGVLPAKWVYDSDVYNCLEKLGFKPTYGEKDGVSGLFYFVKIIS